MMSDTPKLEYLTKVDIKNGIKIPPKGMATFIEPNTVPAISVYNNPAWVSINGSKAEMDNPASKITP